MTIIPLYDKMRRIRKEKSKHLLPFLFFSSSSDFLSTLLLLFLASLIFSASSVKREKKVLIFNLCLLPLLQEISRMTATFLFFPSSLLLHICFCLSLFQPLYLHLFIHSIDKFFLLYRKKISVLSSLYFCSLFILLVRIRREKNYKEKIQEKYKSC